MAPMAQLVPFPFSAMSDAEILEILSHYSCPSLPQYNNQRLSGPGCHFPEAGTLQKRSARGTAPRFHDPTSMTWLILVLLIAVVVIAGIVRFCIRRRSQKCKRRQPENTFARHWPSQSELEAWPRLSWCETASAHSAGGAPVRWLTSRYGAALIMEEARSMRSLDTQLDHGTTTTEEAEDCIAALGLPRSERPSDFNKSMFRPHRLSSRVTI